MKYAKFACWFTIFIGTVASAAASVGFLLSPTYPTGLGSISSVVGDFNGDGKPDIAVAGVVNFEDVAVSIMLNNGDGTFQAPQVYTESNCPEAISTGIIVTADFNRDGKLDVAVTNKFSEQFGYDSAVCVALGNGDGTLRPAIAYDSGGEFASFVTVGDWNHDGIPDLFVTNQDDGPDEHGTLGVLTGNGDGTFSTPFKILLGFFDNWVTVGDFNRDGTVDAAVIDEGELQVLLSLSGSPIFVNAGQSPATVTTHDMNGDGIPDFVVTTEFSLVEVLLGNGDGTFQNPISYPGEPGMAVVADVNGDGKADVLVVGNNLAGVMLGNGDGTLQPEVLYDVGGANWLGGADLNGDGHPDLAVTTSNQTVSIVLGNGDGTFRAPLVQATPMTGPVITGDFNRDGKLDVATLNINGGQVNVLLGNGDGTLQAALNFDVGLNTFPEGLTAGDFNGDGKPDLATANSEGSVSVLLGNGDGTFPPATIYNIGAPAFYVAAGDLNGDGKADLAVAAGSLFVLLNNGDGTFQSPVPYAAGGGPTSVTIADLNGDGINDLAVPDYYRHEKGTVGVLFGNGDGTFQAAQRHFALTAPTSVIRAGDLNRDGNQDLVIGGIELYVLSGNGNGTFSPRTYSTSIGTDIALADFDGDGALDVAGTGYSGLTVALNSQAFQGASYATGAYHVTTGEFNGDNAPDVALSVGAGVTVLLNTGGTLATLSSSANPSTLRQPVDFKVIVKASVNDARVGTPTGLVTFKDGASIIGTATLSDGHADFRTSQLAAGSHPITATYVGDNTFNRNVSAPLTQIVQ